MKILVCVKQCYDPESKIVVSDGKILEAGLRLTVNPYDVVALTQAAKLKKAGIADEIVAVMVEPEDKESTMRHALAVGADRGIVMSAEGELDQLAVANILADVIRQEKPDLVMMGHLSSDCSSSQIAARLSVELGMPAITMASSIEIQGDSVVGTHDIDDVRVVSRAKLPAIVSVQVYITQAHYVGMKSLMQAKKKSTEIIDCEFQPSPFHVMAYEPPASKAAGVVVTGEPEETAASLAGWLENVAGLNVSIA